MATSIIMPKQGLQMTEGTILKWLVREGEPVSEGSPLFEMETDKLTITINAEAGGTLLKILRGEGETVPITHRIAVIGETGEDISSLLTESAPEPEVKPQSGALPVPAASAPVPSGSKAPDGEKLATPRARMTAEKKGLEWTSLKGSGPDGLIIERDVLAGTPAASPLARKTARLEGVALADIEGTGLRGKIMRKDVLASIPAASVTRTGKHMPVTGMRRVIAQRMQQSLQTTAQANHRIKVRASEMTRWRQSLKAAGKDNISYNDLIAYCVCRALLDLPQMNSEMCAETIYQKDFVNLGIAVALEDGLVVPVVKDADLMGLEELAANIRSLAEKARSGQLPPEAFSGGSFTISNLGMFGLESFTAILNPPETGILAVGKIEDEPQAVDGRVEIMPVMRLSLTYDHRVVDGAPAARFLARVRDLLENPYLLM